MIGPLDTQAGDVLLAANQTGSGGAGVNWELILLVGVVATVILGIGWLVFGKSGGGGAD